MRAVLLFAGLTFVASVATASPAADAQVIVAAERAFAADAAEHGWAWAFRRHHAPGAIVLQPDPIEAAVSLAKVEGDGAKTLDWRPAYAGIARSGDLGFTTGPFLIRGGDGKAVGHYFTVWQKQPDGTWKWIFDAGTDVVDPAPIAVDFTVPTLPIAEGDAGGQAQALATVAEIEGDACVDGLVACLANDARVNRVGARPAIGRDASAELMRADGAVQFKTLAHHASAAGDMVFSLGEVRDTHEGKDRLRYFARIWQHRPEGWRMVFDEIVPRRG